MSPRTSNRSTRSRRQFLQATAGGAAASLIAPQLLLGRKTESKSAIIGEGQYRYECHHDYFKLPSGHFGNASHGVTIDREGLIYITHHGEPGSIFVFDPAGKFVRAMGEQFMEQGHGVGHGIDIRQEGNEEFLYLSPNNFTLGFAKINLKGEIVWQKDRNTIAKDSGLYDKPSGKFRATNLNFTPDGGYFLGDGYGSGYIHRYGKDDKYIASFGGSGTTDGKFQTPHGQWLDERDGTPKVVVCDRANKRLQYFDLEGKYLSKLEGFLFPADVDIQGDLMLVPDLHCRVTLLDKDNKVITQLGEDAAWRERALAGFKMRGQRDQWQAGKFVHPHDACFDANGDIFVVEWVQTGRCTKLVRVDRA